MNKLQNKSSQKSHKPGFGALDLLKYIGPGLLVTIGFIDPGNWASNVAAGAEFGYTLLWVITLSTLMLIILQHNVAHLGIVTGLCLAEACVQYIPKKLSTTILSSAFLISIATSMAEILGAAIALQMLFDIPIILGAVLATAFVIVMLFTNRYHRIERWIIAFVSIIGLSFMYELSLVHIDWGAAAKSWLTPSLPEGSILLVMSVLGAVVMPHNLFLHSEIIQSRQWNLEDDQVIKKQLRYEFVDTLISMGIGWGINSAMVLLAAATFFQNGIVVDSLSQAKEVLQPLVGDNAGVIFAFALLAAGIASTITSGIASGSIFSGFFKESYDIKDSHSKVGVLLSLGIALLVIVFIKNPFQGLIVSQMLLSIQLPITVFTQIYLTSSKKVMGKYVNRLSAKIILFTLGIVLTYLNIRLLVSVF